MARLDPYVRAHLEWLGFVQPTGLVVSAPALVRAGAVLPQRDAEGQRLLASVAEETEDGAVIRDFEAFARAVLGWEFSPKYYAGTDAAPIPPELELSLPDYQETLRPDYAVAERDPGDDRPDWQLLVRTLPIGRGFDRADGSGLATSAHDRMERLLRETGTPAGLLCNGEALRLISAPRGENSGWLDFPVAAMTQTAGRPICAAMRLLLGQARLLTGPRKQRLAALLEESRRYQGEVSEKLAEQVLHALYELLRGFQAAHDASKGRLLHEPLTEHPDAVYRALLTVILRLVFLLYAEEREMLPTGDETFTRYYSLAGLHERLRADAAHNPDTMDQRYGAWAQLLVLFRMVHDGARAGGFDLPPRHGVLFDPDRFPFLEGRSGAGARQTHERLEPPLVPDGTVFRALEDLLVLDGERISYRALDVEQIGSVYETMMGFRLETATGPSLAVKPTQRRGAPTVVDLDAMLATAPAKRPRWLQERTDRKPSPKVATAVRKADSLEGLHDALSPVIDTAATPEIVAAGAMVLQPSEERRRSGSHYTPRTLTEPIVRTTLEPVLRRLRGDPSAPPRPDDILELKVCDPAMGSGAFLVEACRQLGDALVKAWGAHGGHPEIPADEDEVVFARRLVAQRCLYGVDRNPVAVDLAKMSLWLVTLAREHALTFVDHALRHGDSLVGLSRQQIQAFSWDETAPPLPPVRIASRLERVSELRGQIRAAGEDVSDEMRRDLWDKAQSELAEVRLYGDLVVLAFFSADKPKAREAKRATLAEAVADGRAERYRGDLEEARAADRPLVPFHWPVEFPEVFDRERPGFDAIVGNPPFAGKNTLAAANAASYPQWLKLAHPGSHGNADLVAHFFRRGFDLLREAGALGLIATNTIAQGHTRSTGLRWICTHDGLIYDATRRLKWPGAAAVVVSVVHLAKGEYRGEKRLDGKPVDIITAFLVHRGGNEDPERLEANANQSFQGCIVLGSGFIFDDTDTDGAATPLAERERLIELRRENAEVVSPYIGYAEASRDPCPTARRFVINFGDRSESECRKRWPELLEIVEAKVKPERERKTRTSIDRQRARYWWRFGSPARTLHQGAAVLDRVLVAASQAASWFTLSFLPTGLVYSSNLSVILIPEYSGLAILQSRIHEVWARFFMSTFGDALAYTVTSIFEPFPFPRDWRASGSLEAAGSIYDHWRAELMIANDEGLTKTYNRFHDPDEHGAEIVRLRELHAEMDRAVLEAYGWRDVPTDCEFLLDYEDEDDEESSRRKKPWRYRWPDEVQYDVLARLIELNAERAAEEARGGGGARAARGRKAAAAAESAGEQLFR